MSMFFPEKTILGEGAAFVFILYIVQFAWTLLAALAFLWGDRNALRALEEAEGILPPSEPVPPTDEKLATPDAVQ